MGRRKLEIKRIEDKSRRLVAFSKRRAGLIKKAKHLSVVCDVDVAVIVISATGKLYEFCSGDNNSVERILSSHKKSCIEADERTIEGHSTRFRTCKELLQTVDRLTSMDQSARIAETNTHEFFVADLIQLEQELHAALVQTRSKKTELMMKYISILQEKKKHLTEKKEELKEHVSFLIT